MLLDKTFYIIVDKFGTPVELMSENTSIDYLFEYAGILDRKDEEYAPHKVLEWKLQDTNDARILGEFIQVQERL